MNIFFDTEFIDLGNTVHLLSIGMVRADGKTYYAEDGETDRELAGEWVQKNVIPHLKGPVKSRAEIAKDIREFAGYRPMFWGYFVSYDWLMLSALYGSMMTVPDGWPNHPMDIQQLRVLMNIKQLPEPDKATRHNALADALWTKKAYEYVMSHLNP